MFRPASKKKDPQYTERESTKAAVLPGATPVHYDGTLNMTRMVCTLGPSCWSVEGLGELIDAGMTMARFNFSHGDHDAHGASLARLREAAAARPGCQVSAMLDTKGPEIRTGFFAAPNEGGKLTFTAGDELILTSDYSHKSDGTKLAVTYDKLATSVKVGANVLVADGSLVLEVVEVYPKKGEVKTRICNNQTIGERKNMNLPGVKVDLPVLQEKDVNDLVNFAVPQGVDFIAASFVQSADDIAFIRKTLGAAGKDIKIIAKIENQEGLDKFDEILAATDAVMVARGDLGMEIAQERVFLEQKRLVRMCNAAGKPVIVATQMLESMTANPRPTRAEVSDVANAVIDGADAVMLSGETAGGAHPTLSAETMMTIAETANASINHARRYRDLVDDDWESGTVTASEFVTSSAVKASFLMPAVAVIIALVDSGRTAARIAKYRPRVPIIAVVPKSNARHARQLYGAHRGLFPILVEDGLDEAARIAAASAVAIEVLPHAGGLKAVVARGKSGMIRVVELPAGATGASNGGAAAAAAAGIDPEAGKIIAHGAASGDRLARVEAQLAALTGAIERSGVSVESAPGAGLFACM